MNSGTNLRRSSHATTAASSVSAPRGDFEQFRKGEEFWRQNAANCSWPESPEEAQKNTYRAIS